MSHPSAKMAAPAGPPKAGAVPAAKGGVTKEPVIPVIAADSPLDLKTEDITTPFCCALPDEIITDILVQRYTLYNIHPTGARGLNHTRPPESLPSLHIKTSPLNPGNLFETPEL